MSFPECTVEGCTKPSRNTRKPGMCHMHICRVHRHGSPTIVVEHSQRQGRIRGTAHFMWRDTPSYDTAHARIRRGRGPASRYQCVDCGKPARHWSYDYQAAAPLTDVRGPYSADPNDYSPRCVPCHAQFDLNRRTPIAFCKHGHEFTPENTYRTARGHRHCKACGKRRAAEVTARRKKARRDRTGASA